MRKAALVVGALALLCSEAFASQLTPAQYGEVIGRAAARLEEAAKLGDQGGRLARGALKELPERVQIAPAEGGPAAQIDNRELVKGLGRLAKQGKGGLTRAARRLRSLEHSVTATASPAPADADQVLTSVLSRREFRVSWWARFRQWVGCLWIRALGFILDRFFRLVDQLPPGLRLLATIALLAVIGALGVWLVVRLVLRGGLRRAREEAAPAAEPGRRRTYAEWLAAAEASLQQDDYRAALRALHMAALMKLDEAALVSYQDAVTDGRFVRALRDKGLHGLAEALAGLNRLFAASWYGRAPAGPEQYAAARAQWKELEALAV